MYYKKGEYYRRWRGKEWIIFLCLSSTMLSSVTVKVISCSEGYNMSDDLSYGSYFLKKSPIKWEEYLFKNIGKDEKLEGSEITFEMI